jgi:hypothetical protein
MRKEIKNEIGKIQTELQREVSSRAKVEREKGSLMPSAKKHKRFDSLANDQYTTSKKDLLCTGDVPLAVEKLLG